MVEDERPTTSRRDGEPRPGAPEQPAGITELRDEVPDKLRDVSFPSAVRGYDRHAVDTYVKEVNAVIAELEVGRSPRAAVKHALDRVGEQTSGILLRARETADEITASAQVEADETTARAKTEAEEITARARSEAEEIQVRSRGEAAERLQRVEAEAKALQEDADAKLRKLNEDIKAVWQERAELVDEISRLAGRLAKIASDATTRSTAPPEGEDSSAAEQESERR